MKEEIEVKYELKLNEYTLILESIQSSDHKSHNLTDILFNIEKSEKGYDFNRIRIDQSVNIESIFPERKEWRKDGDNWKRIESPFPIKVMQKVRVTTVINNIEVALDKITLNGTERYFVEAEAKAEDISKSELTEFVFKEFGLSPREQAKSYLTMLLENTN